MRAEHKLLSAHARVSLARAQGDHVRGWAAHPPHEVCHVRAHGYARECAHACGWSHPCACAHGHGCGYDHVHALSLPFLTLLVHHRLYRILFLAGTGHTPLLATNKHAISLSH